MYYEIYWSTRAPDGEGEGDWRWRQKARNHEIMASGEAYVTKANAKRAVIAVRGKNVEWPIKFVVVNWSGATVTP